MATNCCPSTAVTEVKDYSAKPGGCRIFAERSGLVVGHRNPGPRVAPAMLHVHTKPLSSPLPLPESLVQFQGTVQPDRDATTAWPGGVLPHDETDQTT